MIVTEASNKIQVRSDQQLDCVFGLNQVFLYKSKRCYFLNNQIVIYFPNSPALSPGTVYQVKVGTSCSSIGQDLQFLQSGIFSLKTQLVLTGSSVAQEVVSRLNVPLRSLASVKINWLFSNKKEVSPVVVKITGVTDIPRDGSIVI